MDRVVAPGATPEQSFQAAAHEALDDARLRRNLGNATRTIREKRAEAVGELPDWEELRAAGGAIKDTALAELPLHLEQLERAVAAAGGIVHWARDGAEAADIALEIARRHGVDEVVKMKSLATDEIGLNDALASGGVEVTETDLAELIIQLDGDVQSHILVPAIHRGRTEIRETFRRGLGRPDLGEDPRELVEAARLYLRERFLTARMGISGANFAVAETGAVCVFESEGNGRMCTTLPEVLVTVMGIEKVIPRWRDMEVFLQLLPRSSTGERLNPYTSIWTGVREDDGPREFHLILLDNGRSQVLADEVGRQALRCIRCSACLNVCPVYSRVGGKAYGSVYPGPIGSILTPQLVHSAEADSLPFASSLCGACADVCPVGIDIPEVLVHLRGKAVKPAAERLSMTALARALGSRRGYERLQRLGHISQRPLIRGGRIGWAPGPFAAWTSVRDLPGVADQTFREWWRLRQADAGEVAGASTGVEIGMATGSRVAAQPPTPPPATLGGEARAQLLGRLSRALEGTPPPPPVPRRYRGGDGPGPGPVVRDEVIARFCRRVEENGARVSVAREDELVTVLGEVCRKASIGRLAVPSGLPTSWRPEGVELVSDTRLPAAQLDVVGAALTGAALGIAEPGAIVLTSAPAEGRRMLTLVPDFHLCVIREDQVVDLITEAVAVLEPAAAAGRPLTFVAGPSATSDIELQRVEGVHGPRTLHVVVTSSMPGLG